MDGITMQTVQGTQFGAALPAAGVPGGLPSAARFSSDSTRRSSAFIAGARVHGEPLLRSRGAEIGCDFFASPSHHTSVQSWSNSACFSRSQFLRNASSFDIPPTGRRCQKKYTLRVNANVNVGEWGARDPTSAEIESNFGDKVVGNEGTEHIKLIPSSLLGLSERSCVPLPPGTAPLSEEEARSMLRKVVGWRLAITNTGLKIWTEWKLKDSDAGKTLFDRIAAVAEAEERFPELHLPETNIARAELWTQSIGGLSMNDFICAAKIDKIKTSDLVKKNRFWA